MPLCTLQRQQQEAGRTLARVQELHAPPSTAAAWHLLFFPHSEIVVGGEATQSEGSGQELGWLFATGRSLVKRLSAPVSVTTLVLRVKITCLAFN